MPTRRHPRGAAFLLAPLLVLLLAGCDSQENVLRPQSPPGRAIAQLWWVMLAGAGIGFAVIVFLLFLGWKRRTREGLPFGGGDRAASMLIVALGVAVPLVVLSLLFVWSDLFVIRQTAAPTEGSTAMTVEVIGHQWFWEARYPGTKAVTANEIHIPARTRVNLVVRTADVIHSFWAPQLNRKIDAIPGQVNRILLYADQPGIYRGQCAEYCGVQHAHMSFEVVAQTPAAFRAWLANQANSARAPSGPLEGRGERTFLSLPCAGCHTIRGTSAEGRVGPDLTHLASRKTLAGVLIPNRRGYLAGWILDPQHLKPGNKMPGLNLEGPEFQALLDYLESLK